VKVGEELVEPWQGNVSRVGFSWNGQESSKQPDHVVQVGSRPFRTMSTGDCRRQSPMNERSWWAALAEQHRDRVREAAERVSRICLGAQAVRCLPVAQSRWEAAGSPCRPIMATQRLRRHLTTTSEAGVIMRWAVQPGSDSCFWGELGGQVA
jgi:hypothetical protein